MPPYADLAISLPCSYRRLFTSSVVLSSILAFLGGGSYASQSPDSANEALLNPISESKPASGRNEGFAYSVSTSPDVVEPAQLAQMPSGVPPQGGIPVPWNGTQIQSGFPPFIPGATPGVPSQALPSGQWTMIWMPYTVPVAGYADQGTQMMTVYLPVWAQMGSAGDSPATASPQGGLPPGIYPSPGYPPAILPWGYAQGNYPPTAMGITAPGIPYGFTPYSSPTPDAPWASQPGVQSYALGASSTTTQAPLTVPTLPDTTINRTYGVPAPPSVAQTAPSYSEPRPYTTSSVPFNSVSSPSQPVPPMGPTGISSSAAITGAAAEITPQVAGVEPNRPITEPNLDLQGLYVLQGDNSSARARLSGEAFLTPNLMVGGALDLVTGPDLTNDDGVELTELYLATSVPGAPGLRFRLGQLDMTSYFDRNSFAKDIGRDFFNSTFHTNPALIAGANATASRPGGLVQWAVTDDIALNAAVFSSASDITDFALDGFAGEVDVRTGNLIVRGTFLTARDSQFQNSGGRLDSYGVNAEWFIPEANIGLFGRYGHLNNNGTGFSGDTYSFGLNALDIFMENDRLGLGYGRNLQTAVAADETPDVLELFYDFEVTPNIRLGFTFQQRDQLRESYAGFRVRGDLDLLPRRSAE